MNKSIFSSVFIFCLSVLVPLVGYQNCSQLSGNQETPDRLSSNTRNDPFLNNKDSAGMSFGERDINSEDALSVKTSYDTESEPLEIYLAPDGDNSQSGLSVDEPVLTLERAEALVAADGGHRDVIVYIAPGRYFGQKITWTTTMLNHSITFRRLFSGGDRPVFDGCLVPPPAPAEECPGGTWFKLTHSRGEATNLRFEYIRVENYQTAISLNGSRNQESTSNSHNRIYGCYFFNIGNDFNSELKPSTAAVRLVNSDDNRIVNNHFVRIINASRGGLLHAIYVAHMSDRNSILRNRFWFGTGDPVRVRDYSNDNTISNNRFIQIGTEAGYTDWYCDHDERDDCTKQGPECPSWGNQFRNNFLDGTMKCKTLRGFHYYQDDTTSGCVAPTGKRRLRTSGNTVSDLPCSAY